MALSVVVGGSHFSIIIAHSYQMYMFYTEFSDAYGVDERVTLILSPGVMVSFSDSGQYWVLFSCGAGHTLDNRESQTTL